MDELINEKCNSKCAITLCQSAYCQRVCQVVTYNQRSPQNCLAAKLKGPYKIQSYINAYIHRTITTTGNKQAKLHTSKQLVQIKNIP